MDPLPLRIIWKGRGEEGDGYNGYGDDVAFDEAGIGDGVSFGGGGYAEPPGPTAGRPGESWHPRVRVCECVRVCFPLFPDGSNGLGATST